ncbi:MAG: hypothetical protein OZ928_16575 [Polyangiaceae bacterium]|nr:hypothetical protein [Polyangiaceae bacterium]
MRSSSRAAGTLAGLAAMAAAALGVALARPRLAARFHELRVTSDSYGLPSPERTVVASLGYRAALADLLYADTLVAYGLHFQERRRFEFVGDYLDTVSALDPKFATPYRFADTLLTLQPVKPRYEDYVRARKILERGMRELPYDEQLHNSAGQFMAYLAVSALKSDEERAEWRLAGARALQRACELVGDNPNIPYHCITAATLLTNAGKREAMVQFLERLLAVSDDPEVRKLALGYLEQQLGNTQREEVEQRFLRFHDAWGKDLGFVSRGVLLIVGPRFDPARCAGLERALEPGCATTWADWSRAADARSGAAAPSPPAR